MVKNGPVDAGDVTDPGSIPGLGGSPGRGHGNPLQYSCSENAMDRGAWWTTLRGIAESDVTEATVCVHAELAGWRGGVAIGYTVGIGEHGGE